MIDMHRSFILLHLLLRHVLSRLWSCRGLGLLLWLRRHTLLRLSWSHLSISLPVHLLQSSLLLLLLLIHLCLGRISTRSR